MLPDLNEKDQSIYLLRAWNLGRVIMEERHGDMRLVPDDVTELWPSHRRSNLREMLILSNRNPEGKARESGFMEVR